MLARSLPWFAVTLALAGACSATTAGLGDGGSGFDSETGDEAGLATETAGDGEEAGTADGSTGDEANSSGAGDGDGDGDADSDDADTSDGPECGDGLVDPGEDCDTASLAGSDCATLGFVAGELGCAADCSFDTSACTDQVCGNGIVEGDESCDGAELGEATCVTLGFGKGAGLSCTGTCEFDTDGCPPPGEGDSCGWGNSCPFNYLSCVGGTCYDGSLGDPCDYSWDCKNGLSCPLLGGKCQ
jgi:hypothetical protein